MGRDKLRLDVDGRTLLALTLDRVAATGDLFDRIVVVSGREHWEEITGMAAAAGMRAALGLVAGGARRQDSVRNGLEVCGDAEIIAVHDAARPNPDPGLFARVVEAARVHGAATTAVGIVDTVKRVDADRMVTATLDRSELVAVQTPQAFVAEVLRAAHERALAAGDAADDDCALVELLGAPVAVVDGDPANLKVTRVADLDVLRALLGAAGAPAGRVVR